MTPVLSHSVPGVISDLQSIVVQPGITASMAYTVEWDSWPVRGQGAQVATWYVEQGTEGVNDYAQTNEPGAGNGTRTGGSLYHQKPTVLTDTRYQFFMQNLGEGNVQIVASTLTISVSGRRSAGIAWGCKPQPAQWPFP
jgi:hypothetical protein